MPRPCQHAAEPPQPETCHICMLYTTRFDYRSLWDGDGQNVSSPVLPGRTKSCRFLGPILERAPCDCDSKHVYDCEVHDRCTKGPNNGSAACCLSCEEYEETMPTPEEIRPNTPVATVAEVLRGPPGNFPEGWTGWDNVRDAHIQLLDEVAVAAPIFPEGRYKGRGIVSCVSAKSGWSSGKCLDHGYLPGAWVMVKELRRLGCKLPITFAHLGPLEWDPTLTALFAAHDVSVIDLREFEKQEKFRILAGWESKLAAVMACSHEEVLFLDADNIPIADPTPLFGERRYRETGAIFWPDLPPQGQVDGRTEWLPPVVWENLGMKHRANVDFESGQFVIDKRKCHHEIAVAKFLNDHSDWTYKFVFGDKSIYHLAWAKLGRDYAMPEKSCGWNGGAIHQYGLDGNLLFEHGCQNKPTLHGYPHGQDCLTNAAHCHRHLEDLRRVWSGRLWYNESPSGKDRVTQRRLIGSTFRYRRLGIDDRAMRLLEDNRIGKGSARCEIFWSVLDGILAILNVDYVPTMLLREGGDGVWRGEWLDHERCKVEMVPQAVSNQAG